MHSTSLVYSLYQQVTSALKKVRELTDEDAYLQPLVEQTRRLEQDQQMVAVFGAFSAGKSSLLNAIVAQNTLAVSPNPTTATVSRIKYSPDGQIHITAKSTAELWQDVQSALTQLRLSASSLAEAYVAAKSLRMKDFTPLQRKWAAFLKAFANGYEEMKDRLDSSWHAELAALSRYTAEEAIASYISSVDIMQPLEPLQNGMVLVDTPGVDSIHRRHSEVTFRYMKDADVVIFVLYYTHAFSRADRDFLQQLTDVQALLGQNKLMVVVNASDLAVSEDELQDVLKRVTTELRTLGLHQAPVFAVSSQLAFVAQQWEQGELTSELEQLLRHRLNLHDSPLPNRQEVWERSGFAPLTSALQRLLHSYHDELVGQRVARSFLEVAQNIGDYVHYMTDLTQQREQTLVELAQHREQVYAFLQDMRQQALGGELPEEQSVQTDWDELTFHAGERIRLKLQRLFREAFYPGRFRNEAKTRVLLQDAAQEFTNMLISQLDIESRTLGLRFETAVTAVLSDISTTISTQLSELHLSFRVPASSQLEPSAEDVSAPLQMKFDSEVLQPVFKHFKNPRHFFEQGGQDDAVRETNEMVLPLIRKEMQKSHEHHAHKALQLFRSKCTALIDKAMEQLRDFHPEKTGVSSAHTVTDWQAVEQWLREQAGVAQQWSHAENEAVPH